MLKGGGCTDLGRTRPINEDGYFIADYNSECDAIYAVVADGMGGHKAGEVASAMAICEIRDAVNERCFGNMTGTDIKDMLVTAVKKANRLIYQKSQEDKSFGGMGTTVTLCLLFGDKGYVAHVGDSRAYVLRDGRLHQITTDHSLVYELVKIGQITAEEAAHHPQKNVITRALGTDSGVEIDLYEFSILPGDLVLLCSDGLTNMLSDSELIAILTEKQGDSLTGLAESLISSANEKGGYDNITAVLLAKESEFCGKDCDCV